MDVPTFGEAIYDLIKQCDEEMDTGIQLLLDSHLAGLTAVGNGKLTFSQQWVKLANSFAEWFQGKFFTGSSSTVDVYSDTGYRFADGNLYYFGDSKLRGTNILSGHSIGDTWSIPITDSVTWTFTWTRPYSVAYLTIDNFTNSNGSGNFNIEDYDCVSFRFSPTTVKYLTLQGYKANGSVGIYADYATNVTKADLDYITRGITAEKPQEVHYPDVAEDGSQVYEITVDGVTATDIEGIIQGAVDQILAGTAAIAGEVTQAQDVPAEPEVPSELDGLDLPALGAALTSRFPFSIPWDVSRGISLLAAPAEAPYWEVDFLAPISYRVGGWEGSTTVVLDFSEFEIIGRLCRWTSTIGFCLMLAAGTKRLIWVA